MSKAAWSYAWLIDLSLAIRTNPEDFFLALRLFRAIVFRGEVTCNRFENILENLADVIIASPQDFEREELIKILKAWIGRITSGHTIHFGCGSGAFSDHRKLLVHRFCVHFDLNIPRFLKQIKETSCACRGHRLIYATDQTSRPS